MPKKSKRGRPRGSTKKKEVKKNTGFWRGVGAIAIIIVGIILLFGAFVDAPIPKGLWDGGWSAVGGSTLIIPFVLIYLGALKFLSEDQRIPATKVVGAAAMVLFFSSWLHTLFLHNDLN